MPSRCGTARLALLVAISAVASAPPADARSTERLRLDGEVPSVCVLRISDVATTIRLEGGLDNQPIATVGERCNGQDGYRVVLISSNDGALAGNGKRIDYTVSYGPLQDAILDQPRAVVNRSAQTDWQTRTLAISVPAMAAAAAVSDSVIISIEAP